MKFPDRTIQKPVKNGDLSVLYKIFFLQTKCTSYHPSIKGSPQRKSYNRFRMAHIPKTLFSIYPEAYRSILTTFSAHILKGMHPG